MLPFPGLEIQWAELFWRAVEDRCGSSVRGRFRVGCLELQNPPKHACARSAGATCWVGGYHKSRFNLMCVSDPSLFGIPVLSV
jgi:hypothetical protein